MKISMGILGHLIHSNHLWLVGEFNFYEKKCVWFEKIADKAWLPKVKAYLVSVCVLYKSKNSETTISNFALHKGYRQFKHKEFKPNSYTTTNLRWNGVSGPFMATAATFSRDFQALWTGIVIDSGGQSESKSTSDSKKRKSLRTQKNYLKNDTNSKLTRIMKRIGIITINGHLNMLIKMLYKWDSNKWVWENMQDLFLDWLTLFFTLCASFYGTDHRMEFVMRIFFMNTRV